MYYCVVSSEGSMDSETLEEAWKEYKATKLKYTLEGDQMHRLACALYVACRRGTAPCTYLGALDSVSTSIN